MRKRSVFLRILHLGNIYSKRFSRVKEKAHKHAVGTLTLNVHGT